MNMSSNQITLNTSQARLGISAIRQSLERAMVLRDQAKREYEVAKTKLENADQSVNDARYLIEQMEALIKREKIGIAASIKDFFHNVYSPSQTWEQKVEYALLANTKPMTRVDILEYLKTIDKDVAARDDEKSLSTLAPTISGMIKAGKIVAFTQDLSNYYYYLPIVDGKIPDTHLPIPKNMEKVT